MSWAEVRKINSDLNVPLDERAKYIAGSIPRGLLKKTITSNTPSEPAIILDVQGQGILLDATLVVSSHWGVGSAEITIYIDGETFTKLSDMYLFARVNDNNSRVTKILTDLSDVCSNNLEQISPGTTCIQNKPMIFKKSLKIVHVSNGYKNGDSGSVSTNATVNYCLF